MGKVDTLSGCCTASAPPMDKGGVARDDAIDDVDVVKAGGTGALQRS